MVKKKTPIPNSRFVGTSSSLNGRELVFNLIYLLRHHLQFNKVENFQQQSMVEINIHQFWNKSEVLFLHYGNIISKHQRKIQ